MVLNSEFATSNKNKSKNTYDTIIYNAEAMDQNKSDLEETPIRLHDYSLRSNQKPLNKSRDCGDSATRNHGISNTYASMNQRKRNYLFE